MRLIDADELIKRFKELKGIDSLANMFITDVINEVKKQPAAYDMDKVVEQIELLSENAEHNDLNTYEEKAAYNTAYSNSMEIVKAGGIDGQGLANFLY